jgi:hypothetical protein
MNSLLVETRNKSTLYAPILYWSGARHWDQLDAENGNGNMPSSWLEKKIQDLQNAIRENTKDHRKSVQWLEAENRELRELLANKGTGFNQSGMPESRDSQEDSSNAVAQATLCEEGSARSTLPDEVVSCMEVLLGNGPPRGVSSPIADLDRL